MRILFSAPVVALCLTACAHGQAQFSSGSVSTSTPGVSVQGGGSGAAALVGIGVAAALIYSAEPDGAGYYNANPFMAVTGSAKPPPLAPDRRVNEQDCSRPIEDLSANLKCR